MTQRTRWFTGAVVAALAAGLTAVPAGGSGVAVAVFEGRGWGHGVGMAQDGAYWMGVEGASAGEILGHFYPGTGLGEAGGNVVVVVHTVEGDAGAWIEFPAGGQVRAPLYGPQHPGFPVSVPPGGSVLVRHDGGAHIVEGGTPAGAGASASGSGAGPASAPPGVGFRVTAAQTAAQLPTAPIDPLPTTTTTAPPHGTTTTTSPRPAPPPGDPPPEDPPPPHEPPPPGPPPPAGVPRSPEPVWAITGEGHTLHLPARERRYRGVIEAAGGQGQLRLRNHVDVEQYLRGMGEVRDPGWPQAALQAQAIAARTYALRAMAVTGELCDVQRCQVYLGQQAEYAAMDAAVATTRGQVLVHGGRLISAVYSANAGGVSATTEEGFGTAGAPHPYLRAAPYLTRDPAPWELTVSLAELGRRLGYRGTLEQVRVAAVGPSDRPTELELRGDAGTALVPALAVRAALGLRSTLWDVRLDVADEAPPPPDPDPDLHGQALPEDLLALELVAPGGPAGGADAGGGTGAGAAAPPGGPAGRTGTAPALVAALLLALLAAAVIGGAAVRADTA